MHPSAPEPWPTEAAGGRIGPFVLRRRLGTGGSAEVWEAVMEGPGGFQKPVALKILRDALQRDPAWRGHFLREARLGARLQHPNLVSTLLVHEVDGRTCVALELVRGCTASDLVRRRKGPLPANALLEVALQTVDALDHIHTFTLEGRPAGVIHRDVKPSNLLLDVHGGVKLADLGISIPTDEGSPFAGTPGYAAPEQLAGRAEPRSDLFALGVTLYALAATRGPFGSGLAAMEATQEVEEHLRQPGFLEPVDAVIPGLGEVIRRCLRFDPADRPASAAALRPALEALRPAATAGPPLRRMVSEAIDARDDTSRSAATAATVQLSVGNLPEARDSFVGRREELEHLHALVARDPWVVVTGPGGLGKTRLTLEVARSGAVRFSGGCWLFDLAPARTVDEVCAAVAQALRVPLQSSDPVRQLGHALSALGSCLLVLDNLEQCVDALPPTLERWRALAPLARFLGSSRIRPGLPGETVFSLGALEPADAVRLFEQRSPRPLRPEERAKVADLCAALDGMPLAVELAAARLRVLGVEDIVRRLSMRMLAGGGAERPERHRSLEASLAWSWDLLSAWGRAALAQVSVFEGSFDWSAAEAVLDLGPEGPWALDALQELMDASLVRADGVHGRLSTWLVVREFARERLSPTDRAAAELRHGRHYAIRSRDRATLPPELDNLVAACRRAVARGDAEVALATMERAGLVFALQGPYPSWAALVAEVRGMALAPAQELAARAAHAASTITLGRHQEIRTLLQDAVLRWDAMGPTERAEAPPGTEIRLLTQLGQVLIRQHALPEGEAVVTRWLERCRAAGDRSGEAAALSHLGHLQMARGDVHAAEATTDLATLTYHEAGDGSGEAISHRQRGVLAMRSGQPEVALVCYRTALRLAAEVGDRNNEGRTLLSLAAAHQTLGQLEAAHEQSLLAVQRLRAVGNRVSEGAALGNLGTVLDELGRPEEAAEALSRSIAIHVEHRDPTAEGIARANLADLRRRQGRLAEAQALARKARETLPPAERRVLLPVLCILGEVETDLGRWEAARAAFAEGDVLPAAVTAPADQATLLAARARCEARAGRPDDARRWLAEARALAAPLRPTPTSALGRALADAAAAVGSAG